MTKPSKKCNTPRAKCVFVPKAFVGRILASVLAAAAISFVAQISVEKNMALSAIVDDMQSVKSEIADARQSISRPDDSVSQIGDAILFFEQSAPTTQTPSSVSEGVSVSKLCDSQINASIASYREQQRIAAAQKEASSRAGMVGRLIIPSAGINVALISAPISLGTAPVQAITDAADSCAYITGFIPGAVILADHSNQDFRGLTSVGVGTTGMIVTSTEVINIVATTVFNGHNNGSLVDANMTPIGAIAPYIAYTCLDNSFNIRIVGFGIR